MSQTSAACAIFRVSARSVFGFISRARPNDVSSFATGTAAAIIFVSLVLTPVAAYAAHAQPDQAAMPSTYRKELGTRIEPRRTAPLDGRYVEKTGSPDDSLLAVPVRQGPMIRLPGHLPRILERASLVVPHQNVRKRRAQPLTLTLVLRRDDAAGFSRYLHDVYDPHSPDFHHFLTPSAVSDRFGPSLRSYEALSRYLHKNGFKFEQGSSNRLTLTVRGTRARVERTFGVRIGDYQIGRRTFYANATDPALPAQLAPLVQAVLGLSNLAQPARAGEKVLKALCHAIHAADFVLITFTLVIEPIPIIASIVLCWMFETILDALNHEPGTPYKDPFGPYNPFGPNGPFHGSSSTPDQPSTPGISPETAKAGDSISLLPFAAGAGQTVGLLEFDGFHTSDVSDYVSLATMAQATVAPIGNLSVVPINGGVPTPGAGETEVLLDIDTVMSLAPGAKVAVYEAPFSGQATSFTQLFNAMITGGVSVISNSWASCEDQISLSEAQSIDSALQSAAASGISVFNGSGDAGSTCLDGSPNTVSVPADSPNATAVGGTTLTQNPGLTYGSETWWNGTSATPPTGMGGFGVSKFFSRPSYQNGLSTSAARSVPDVVINADPARGAIICQADDGGCPNSYLNGGTSMAAPIWAAFAALINAAAGTNLGAYNTLLYPLAKTDAFHGPAALGTDFAHVGLGAPNFNILLRSMFGQAVGPVDATRSETIALVHPGASIDVAADNSTPGGVLVTLRDVNGNTISGKTLKLSANPGSHATISPSSGIANVANGAVTFMVTDATPEKVTFTATDATDGITLKQTTSLGFVEPPATGAGLDAFPASVTADGKSNAVITVTLKDSLGRPSSGKLVSIAQGSGHSVIAGPIPSVTNAAGQVQFNAVDQVAETVTYTAVDITDGNVPFPTTGTVVFTGGPANGCGNSAPPAAPGFLVTPYATGFIAQNYNYGDIDFAGCPGAYGMAFDAAGNLYVSDSPTGNIYRFKPGGGVADSTTLLTDHCNRAVAGRPGLRPERTVCSPAATPPPATSPPERYSRSIPPTAPSSTPSRPI